MIFSRISNIKSCELNHYVILFLDLPVHDPIMYVLKLRCYDRKDSLSFPLRSMLNTMNNAYHKDVSIFYYNKKDFIKGEVKLQGKCRFRGWKTNVAVMCRFYFLLIIAKMPRTQQPVKSVVVLC